MNKQSASPGESGVPKAVQDCHQLLEWLIPLLDKFPRSRRFTLGDRLETGLLNVLENLLKASYAGNKVAILQTANVQLDIVRHLWRLSFNLQVISVKRYEHGSGMMIQLGRQIGGWRKQSSRRGET